METAKEFFAKLQYPNDLRGLEYVEKDITTGKHLYSAREAIEFGIKFAKLHVEVALKEASEQANMFGETQHNNNAPDRTEDFIYVVDSNGPDYGYVVNKKSILEAYPLDNIK